MSAQTTSSCGQLFIMSQRSHLSYNDRWLKGASSAHTQLVRTSSLRFPNIRDIREYLIPDCESIGVGARLYATLGI